MLPQIEALCPVFDHQAVLRIAPEKILRVDVINAVYVKGEIFHGGLISIISRKGDMTGIDLPDGSYFFDFQSMNSPKIWNFCSARLNHTA